MSREKKLFEIISILSMLTIKWDLVIVVHGVKYLFL